MVDHSRPASLGNPSGRGGSGARGRTDEDDTDYGHQHFVNLVAAAFLLVIAIAIIWTFKSMDAYEKQRSCLDSGRKACVQLDALRR